MRAWIGALALLGCIAGGCDDDIGSNTVNDLSVVVNPDMTMVFGTDNCLAVVTCASGCSGAAACLQACAAKGTQQAQQKYQAVGACAVAGCTAHPDGGGAAPCSSAGDTNPTCLTCITDFAQSPACMTQLGACLADK